MTLQEILNDIEHVSDEFVIFATRDGDWRLDSPAALLHLEEAMTTDVDPGGLTYFLEAEIANEVLKVWKAWRDGREPSEHERVHALLYYANNDAYFAEG